ncbi:MAG: hypothetical protein JO144_03750 [Actinobacteria bacterium]|nr:hypothetical protein [Actinomycetota bacterium]
MTRAVARTVLGALLVVAALLGLAATPAATASQTSQPSQPSASPPNLALFAYYYQWFVPDSWKRAKVDLPALGAYSSDDVWVMRQHIEQAKAAGITGFIVSWKDTPTNTRRLRALVAVAAEEHFTLSMIYQGLDFDRKPLPAARVAADFVTFARQFAGNPVFARLGGKPLTIFSGTWAYSHADVARITSGVRPGLLVLSTEKSVEGYRRLADVTDGDAYYWSSVNPATNPNYAGKLNAMSAAVHADDHYWIAPFAPGFDARLVGGTKSVPRADGRTLRAEYAAALRSSPDALGLISWNEFSENTYVEPSKQYGHRYLDILAELRHTQPPAPASAEDSSAQPVPTTPGSGWPTIGLLIGIAVLAPVGLALLGRRLRRRSRAARAGRRQHPSETVERSLTR